MYKMAFQQTYRLICDDYLHDVLRYLGIKNGSYFRGSRLNLDISMYNAHHVLSGRWGGIFISFNIDDYTPALTSVELIRQIEEKRKYVNMEWVRLQASHGDVGSIEYLKYQKFLSQMRMEQI